MGRRSQVVNGSIGSDFVFSERNGKFGGLPTSNVQFFKIFCFAFASTAPQHFIFVNIF